MAVICGNDGVQLPVTDTLASVGLQAALFQQLDSGKVAAVTASPSSLVAKRHGSGLLQTSQAKPPIDCGITDAHSAIVRIIQPNTARRPGLQQMPSDVVGQFAISILPGTPPVNSAAVQLVRW